MQVQLHNSHKLIEIVVQISNFEILSFVEEVAEPKPVEPHQRVAVE